VHIYIYLYIYGTCTAGEGLEAQELAFRIFWSMCFAWPRQQVGHWREVIAPY
jgi:hypothetical protein